MRAVSFVPCSACALLVLGSWYGWLPAAATATISGTVTTTAGKPIRAAVTVHDVSTARVQGQTPFDSQYASKSDGTFLFSNVPAGKYQICVEAPHENVLDPCLWSPTVNVVDISNGAPVSGLAVQVATGYMLQVHVNDPAALLPAAVGGTAGPALSVMAITQTKSVSQFPFARCECDGAGPLFAGAVRSDFDAGDSEFEPCAEQCAESALQRGCAAGSGADSIGREFGAGGGECG